MLFEFGKIFKYDSGVGEILSISGDKYIFLENDLKEDYEKINGKVIIFRPEIINNEKRAFYIQNIENTLKNKDERDKILKKISFINEFK